MSDDKAETSASPNAKGEVEEAQTEAAEGEPEAGEAAESTGDAAKEQERKKEEAGEEQEAEDPEVTQVTTGTIQEEEQQPNQTEAQPEPKAEPEAETKVETAAEPEVEPAAETAAEPEAEPEAEKAAEPKVEPKAEEEQQTAPTTAAETAEAVAEVVEEGAGAAQEVEATGKEKKADAENVEQKIEKGDASPAAAASPVVVNQTASPAKELPAAVDGPTTDGAEEGEAGGADAAPPSDTSSSSRASTPLEPNIDDGQPTTPNQPLAAPAPLQPAAGVTAAAAPAPAPSFSSGPASAPAPTPAPAAPAPAPAPAASAAPAPAEKVEERLENRVDKPTESASISLPEPGAGNREPGRDRPPMPPTNSAIRHPGASAFTPLNTSTVAAATTAAAITPTPAASGTISPSAFSASVGSSTPYRVPVAQQPQPNAVVQSQPIPYGHPTSSAGLPDVPPPYYQQSHNSQLLGYSPPAESSRRLSSSGGESATFGIGAPVVLERKAESPLPRARGHGVGHAQQHVGIESLSFSPSRPQLQNTPTQTPRSNIGSQLPQIGSPFGGSVNASTPVPSATGTSTPLMQRIEDAASPRRIFESPPSHAGPGAAALPISPPPPVSGLEAITTPTKAQQPPAAAPAVPPAAAAPAAPPSYSQSFPPAGGIAGPSSATIPPAVPPVIGAGFFSGPWLPSTPTPVPAATPSVTPAPPAPPALSSPTPVPASPAPLTPSSQSGPSISSPTAGPVGPRAANVAPAAGGQATAFGAMGIGASAQQGVVSSAQPSYPPAQSVHVPVHVAAPSSPPVSVPPLTEQYAPHVAQQQHILQHQHQQPQHTQVPAPLPLHQQHQHQHHPSAIPGGVRYMGMPDGSYASLPGMGVPGMPVMAGSPPGAPPGFPFGATYGGPPIATGYGGVLQPQPHPHAQTLGSLTPQSQIIGGSNPASRSPNFGKPPSPAQLQAMGVLGPNAGPPPIAVAPSGAGSSVVSNLGGSMPSPLPSAGLYGPSGSTSYTSAPIPAPLPAHATAASSSHVLGSPPPPPPQYVRQSQVGAPAGANGQPQQSQQQEVLPNPELYGGRPLNLPPSPQGAQSPAQAAVNVASSHAFAPPGPPPAVRPVYDERQELNALRATFSAQLSVPPAISRPGNSASF